MRVLRVGHSSNRNPSTFSYNFNVPGSCGDLKVSWTGPLVSLTPNRPSTDFSK